MNKLIMIIVFLVSGCSIQPSYSFAFKYDTTMCISIDNKSKQYTEHMRKAVKVWNMTMVNNDSCYTKLTVGEPANPDHIASEYYGVIKINKNKIHLLTDVGFNCHNEYDIVTVLSHELGHVLLGTNHSSNPQDLMYRKIEFCQVKFPSENEIKKINTTSI